MNTSGMKSDLKIVMIGATGAVGGHVARTLAALPDVSRLTLLGRRSLEDMAQSKVAQHVVDVMEPASFSAFLTGHDIAICTLGVGQPSKVSKKELLRIDKRVPLHFAAACKQSGVRHFELLSSVGASAQSSSFYLRTKGELECELESLAFERLSLFQPSMILTPTNRYGMLQAITLGVWPMVSPLLLGSWRKYRGIRVEQLGRAIALNIMQPGTGLERLHWDNFMTLGSGSSYGAV
jgi:uncharacterized protein YbjT (DUF2867 family)